MTPQEIIDEQLIHAFNRSDCTGEDIISVLDAAGYVIVPKEPTDEMLESVVTADIEWPDQMLLPVSAAEDIYKIMIAQTKKAAPSED